MLRGGRLLSALAGIGFIFALFLSNPIGASGIGFQVNEVNELCSLHGHLKGESRNFWLWGRDAWIGNGTLICPNRPARQILIRYEDWGSGFGTNPTSILELQILSIPVNRVDELLGSFRTHSPGGFVTLENWRTVRATLDSVEWTVLLRLVNPVLPDTQEMFSFGHLTLTDFIEKD